jgi:hypothetical protein
VKSSPIADAVRDIEGDYEMDIYDEEVIVHRPRRFCNLSARNANRKALLARIAAHTPPSDARCGIAQGMGRR